MNDSRRVTLNEIRRKKWMVLLQEMNPDVDPELISLMDNVRQTAHSLHLVSEESLVSAGLSYAKFRLLMGLLISEEIDGVESLNPSEISSRQGTSRNTISALLKDLEDDCLVVRELDLEDRRKFNIKLTDAGRVKVKLHANNHFKTVAECFAFLSDDERQDLSQAMTRIRKRALNKGQSVDNN